MYFLLVALMTGLLAQDRVTIQGKITYLTVDQVYSDVGQIDQVEIGDTLTVLRKNKEIGRIIVTNLASKSSVSSSIVPTETYQLGDRVYLVKQMEKKPETDVQDTTAAEEESATEKVEETKVNRFRHSGNFSLRYSHVTFDAGTNSDRGVSTLQYNLSSLGSFPLTIALYGRGDFISGNYALYQARITLGNRSSLFNAQIGRVFSSELSGMGATDGVMASIHPGENISAGFVFGMQPDPISLTFNRDIKKMGFFGRVQKKTGRLTVLGQTAVVGQYSRGNVDREFLVLKGVIRGRSAWSLRANATVDYYRKQYISTRQSSALTNGELSLRIRPLKSLTISSRLSTNRLIIYRESTTSFVDSLFQDELRSGLFNSITYRHSVIGKFGLGFNMRTGSTDRPSLVGRFSYGTGSYLQKSYGDFVLMYIQNFLITGLRTQLGWGREVGENGHLYFQYEYYTYGYGKLLTGYTQHTFSGNLTHRFGKRFILNTSIEYNNEAAFSILYLYAGATYRF